MKRFVKCFDLHRFILFANDSGVLNNKLLEKNFVYAEKITLGRYRPDKRTLFYHVDLRREILRSRED